MMFLLEHQERRGRSFGRSKTPPAILSRGYPAGHRTNTAVNTELPLQSTAGESNTPLNAKNPTPAATRPRQAANVRGKTAAQAPNTGTRRDAPARAIVGPRRSRRGMAAGSAKGTTTTRPEPNRRTDTTDTDTTNSTNRTANQHTAGHRDTTDRVGPAGRGPTGMPLRPFGPRPRTGRTAARGAPDGRAKALSMGGTTTHPPSMRAHTFSGRGPSPQQEQAPARPDTPPSLIARGC